MYIQSTITKNTKKETQHDGKHDDMKGRKNKGQGKQNDVNAKIWMSTYDELTLQLHANTRKATRLKINEE